MQKILKWFIPFVAFVVAVFLVWFLISINSDEPVEDFKPLKLEKQSTASKQEKSWIDHFSKREREGFSYPVNEVYVKLDLDEKITKIITYKLQAPLLDPYQIFCLKEELKRHHLRYYLKQDKRRGMELLIYSKDKKRLNNLVKVLQNYQIFAKITPYKEEY